MKFTSSTMGFEKAYMESMGAYDEMFSKQGTIRPHWQYLINGLEKLGSAELIKRSQETQRQLHETGVSYNVHDDNQNQNTPWKLDPVPFVIDSKEWVDIEAGLIQRAELLDMILKDLYGPRQLIKTGLLPAELVFAHDGFLRACDGIQNTHCHSLQLYAADLARGDDGRYCILGDRSQTPSGAGFALENRTVMRRILPSLFRDSQVHRLALFFRSLRTQLSSISNGNTNSRTILLTPGPEAETYFEHSYLANYLGYALVQGSDLTSRSGKIWLKSLDGLQAVDVILRYIDDQMCDPLELRQDSNQGIPGLLEATRRGHVSLANPLGSSILENPALQVFLPEICKQIFKQELRLPGVQSWWCGQQDAFNYVMQNFEQLIIKPLSKHTGMASILPAELLPTEREKLRARMTAKPHLFVAQERINYSTTPTLIKGEIKPRSAILRTFISAHGDSYVVMPGGLTRVIPKQSNWTYSNQKDQIISKDTWVLASEPELQISLWTHTSQAKDDYGGVGSLPSRAADNLFWLGRLAERSEDFIRLFRSIINKLDDISEYHDDIDKQGLKMLFQALNIITLHHSKLSFDAAEYQQAVIDNELLQMLLNQQNSSSLKSILSAMVNSAYRVRDLLSSDTWRTISNIETTLDEWKNDAPDDLSKTTDELDALITTLAAFSGLLLESSTREHGWLFLTIGRRMERALWLTGTMKALLVEPQSEDIEEMLLESLLDSSESLMTYRRRYRSNMQMQTVLQLLLLDKTNPRSLSYQLERLKRAISNLPRPHNQFEYSQEQREILQASTLLHLSEIEKLCHVEPDFNNRQLLEQLLSQIIKILHNISQIITDVYFNHSIAPQQLNHNSEP